MSTDFDLHFLQYCENDDLRVLCDILMYDNQGKIRVSERLSNSDSFLKCYPDNMKGMWRELANELQGFGGNSILNYLRDGQGPSYERIVRDVCKRMHVKDLDKDDTIDDMEQKLLLTVSANAIGKLNEDEIRSIMDECKIHGYDYTKQGLIAALLALQAVNRRIFVIVIQTVIRMTTEILVGRGIAMVGMGILSRFISIFCGPIGWLFLTGWTIWDIMGPAYRVTIPAVIQVAYMRVKYLSLSNSK
jgi:uncharacterized protein YaaW (UPF0174 family)